MRTFSKSPLERFRRLTYSQKFAFITLVFALPVIAFIPLFLDQITRIDHYGHKELSGTLYLRPVWQLTADLQSYVLIAHEYSDGNRQISEVNASQASVDTDFESLQKIDSAYNASLLTGNTLETLTAQWAAVKKAVQNRDWQGFDTQQTRLFSSLSDLTARIGDSSYLILDPDLDTYYLMDTVLLKLPENQSLIFDIHRILERAASQDGLSVEDRAQLIVLTGRAEANLDAMRRNIDVAIQNDQTGTIESFVTSPLTEYQTSLQGFADFINTELSNSSSAITLGPEFISRYEDARNTNGLLYGAASQALETGIQNRITTLSFQLYSVIGIAVLSILVAFTIGRSTMRSISLPLLQLFEAAKRLASGDMTTRVAVSQTTELGQVADAFNQMATELERDKSALLARTLELDTARSQSEKRTQTLQTISEISRIISGEQKLEALLPLITQVIGEKFNFYHCAIYLIDEHREFAVLQASNSLEGRQILRSNFKIKLADNNIVEYVVTTGNPRLAWNGGAELIHLNETGTSSGIDSVLVLPVRIAGEVSGLLEIQSPEINAFQKEDTNILLLLADQIAITIQNARSFEQAERALNETKAASRQLTAQAWQGYLETVKARGYRYDGIKPEPLKGTQKSIEEVDALFIPVQLRGQIIGRLKLKASDTKRKWTDDERAIIESTAERVAIALESARLLEDAQKRATRESFLSEVGAKLSTSFQLDSILRDTVEELGQNLKGSTVSFQLINPSAPPSDRS